MSTEDKPRNRRASRVILLDPEGRVLLLHTRDWWITVGGGIDPGETSVEAAIREVREETGIAITAGDLGPVVLETTHLVRWDEGDLVEQTNEFRVAHVAAVEIDTSGFTALEAATIDGARWWSERELRDTDDNVAPAELADLLATATTAAPASATASAPASATASATASAPAGTRP